VNEATILGLVLHGVGVGFVNENARWRCPQGVALLPVTDLKLPLPFALIWRKDNAWQVHSRGHSDLDGGREAQSGNRCFSKPGCGMISRCFAICNQQ